MDVVRNWMREDATGLSVGIVGALVQTVLIAIVPLLALWWRPALASTAGVAAFLALGALGMVALGVLDTPRRLQQFGDWAADHLNNGAQVRNGLALGSWAGALPGSVIGGAVAGVWWAVCTAVVMANTAGPAVGFGQIAVSMLVVAHMAAWTRGGFLLSRAFTVVTRVDALTVADLWVAVVGWLVGISIVVLGAISPFLLFIGAAMHNGTI